MEDIKNVTLTTEQFAELLGRVGKPTQPAPRQQFDGAMVSRVDQERMLRSNEFNKRLVNKEDMVEVRIPSIYSEYVGTSITISVNGNTVKCPVNDQPFMISKAHNHQLQKKLRHINIVNNRNKQSAPKEYGTTGDWGMVTGI